MSLLSDCEEKITKAKTQMVLKHPFFSIVALVLLFRNSTESGKPYITTMATDARHIWWHEDFVQKHSIPELCGVIAHEVLHVVLFHCLRCGNRNPLVWNIACDYAVNLIVIDAGFVLPSDRHHNEKYRGWLVDAIYDDLIEEMDKLESQCSIPGEGDGEGDGQQGKKPLWGTIMEPQNNDGSAMSEAQKSELVEEIKIRAIQAATAAKAVGKLPLALESLIEAIKQPTINWHDYIQAWVSGKTPDNYSWKKPNRKMLGLYNMIAPTVQFNGAGVGVLSIDTSGSVSDRELVEYVSEVVGIIEICNPDKLYIMQHDTKVNRVDVWEPGDDFKNLKVTHRGGTCIRPSFKMAETFDEQIDWMICFTDCGINDYPTVAEAPDFPVLWAATGQDNTPFGTYISLRDAVRAVS